MAPEDEETVTDKQAIKQAIFNPLMSDARQPIRVKQRDTQTMCLMTIWCKFVMWTPLFRSHACSVKPKLSKYLQCNKNMFLVLERRPNRRETTLESSSVTWFTFGSERYTATGTVEVVAEEVTLSWQPNSPALCWCWWARERRSTRPLRYSWVWSGSPCSGRTLSDPHLQSGRQ